MNSYNVTWTIEVEAESPTDAAKQAREIQLDPCSTATIFEIQRVNPLGKRSKIGSQKRIELEPAKPEFVADGSGECLKCGGDLPTRTVLFAPSVSPIDCPDCGARHV